ncbi:glyoxalase [Arthrobacter sp. I2-34]|uniref:Glyoxalase n=1 Tax=Arthrobacter hankyongi TaxID=2904801 RepID=A0ABS9L4B2_9MICC|nr:VOC family protein [Arthrobacter hankyongi]MCG2621514.1 glyoxalase [Arthrobacter hankyongi]
MENRHYPPAGVWAGLQSRDARGLIGFLTGTVGFTTHALYEAGGDVAHAELLWPEGGLVMVSAWTGSGLWAREPGSAQLNVYTHHPDDLYRTVAAAGADIIQEPTDTDYGARSFGLRDPDGNLWGFSDYRGQPLAPPAEEVQDVSFEGHA